MTIEIIEFRCPTCGHILGEEEHRHALSKYGKDKQAIREEERVKYQRENQQLQIENQQLREDIENRVDLKVQSQIDSIRSEEQEKNQQEIRKKDEEIKSLKSQNEQALSEAVDQVLKSSYEEWRQKEKQYQKKNDRAQERIRKLQTTLDNTSSELRGTSAEIILTEDLHKAFPRDVLEEKRVGEEMPDTIQTIVTENGERIATQILWDRKTGNITLHDIKKAKRYKEKYNTDYCILVSSKPIAAKYSKNSTEKVIGRSDDGIMLLHESIAVEMAEEIRNFIIKETRLIKNNNVRTSKQSRLYDYITAPERLRKIKGIRKCKKDLEYEIRKQIEYNIEKWKKEGEIIKEWYKLGSDDQEAIDDITQQDQANEENIPKKDEVNLLCQMTR